MNPLLQSLDATRGTRTNNPACSQGQPASDAGTFALVLGNFTAPQESPADGVTLKQDIAADDKGGLFGVAPMPTPMNGTANRADTEREADAPGQDAETPVDTALIASLLAQLQVRPAASGVSDDAPATANRSGAHAVETAVSSAEMAATSGLPVDVPTTSAPALQDTAQGQAASAVTPDVQRMPTKMPLTPGIDVSPTEALVRPVPDSDISVNPAVSVMTAASAREAHASLTRGIEKNQYKQYVTGSASRNTSNPVEDISGNILPAAIAASASIAQPVAEKPVAGIDIKPPVIQRAGAPQDLSLTDSDDAQALEITSAAAARSMHARSFARPPSVDRAGETLAFAATTPGLIASGAGAIPVLDITPQLGSAEWKPAFNGGVQVLLNNGVTNAALQLNPAELGPVDVRIHMVDQRADISFAVANADAGAAIRSALPELREQLERGGIHLGHTSVGSNGQDGQQAPMPLPQPRSRSYAPDSDTSPVNQPLPPVASRSSNQIDFYA